jgi:hypothetical protein
LSSPSVSFLGKCYAIVGGLGSKQAIDLATKLRPGNASTH